MTVQFEAINPRTQELNFNKVRLERLEENTLNLIPGAQIGPGGGGGEGDAPFQRGGDGGAEAGLDQIFRPGCDDFHDIHPKRMIPSKHLKFL